MSQSKGVTWVHRFAVSDPRVHSKGFTVYRVTSVVYPEAAPEAISRITVWKRYNDFKKLHLHMSELYKNLHLSRQFPKFAKAKFFKRFEEEVINERIICALTLLEFIGDHPPLYTSQTFLKFFESGYHVKGSDFPSPTVWPLNNGNLVPREGTINKTNTQTVINKAGDDAQNNKKPILQLGGTWEFPKTVDCISLSSESSDDCTTFTSDTTETYSGLNSPLQQADMQYFDPIRPEVVISQENVPSNVWLLSNTKDLSSNNNLEADFVFLDNDFTDQTSSLSSRMVQSFTDKSDSPKVNAITKSMSFLAGNVGTIREVVTCHSEKPVKPSEMWLTVRTQDFSCMNQNESRNLLAPGLTDSEAWLTPPGTPAGKQDYLIEAAYHVGQAQNYEASCEYEAAFSFYKAAIACLLSGVHDDEDKVRRKAVRDKTAKYLQRAEHIYSCYLALNNTFTYKTTVSELKIYKVLGVINNVMLVLNTTNEKCYVIKVLEKSSCPIDNKKKSIIPKNVPFMVQYIKHYETDCTVYLVLQYAGGGRLWDHISNYLHSVPPTPTKIRDVSDFENMTENSTESVTENEGQSYLDLIRSYTAYTAKKMFGFNQKDQDFEDDIIDEYGNISNSLLRSESHVIFDKNSILSSNVEATEEKHDIKKIDNATTEVETKNKLLPDVVQKGGKLDNIEVTDLVEISQKLLESVNKTLQESESMVNSVEEIEKSVPNLENISAYPKDQKCEVERPADLKLTTDLKMRRKRSSSTLSRSRIERRFSSDEIFESRSRTASNSLDRGAQWSRLASMIDPQRPRLNESTVRVWAAELLIALETLHRWGVICKDLHPDNVLLADQGHLLVTYQCSWLGVDSLIKKSAVTGLYSAPETRSVFPITYAADWWSYGAILFQLLTGRSLLSAHPNGILCHTLLNIPDFLSTEATSLLTGLLRYDAGERLGGGINGSEDIKSHPFFNPVDWQSIYDSSSVI